MIAASILATLRGLPSLIWPDVSFDSDQAIVGLMAKHLAEGRAFPLYFYGQQYMLAVQAWLAAPLFIIGGVSVALLKLPLVLINAAAAGLLVWTLHRHAQLPPLAAFGASVFFVVVPPVTGAWLVAAMGGSVEPFLYILLIWLLRDRPVWCGAVAGVGFLHREFSLYGLVAVMVTVAVYHRREWRRLAGRWVLTGVAFLLVFELARLLMPLSDPFGPALPKFQFSGSASNVDAVIARVQCESGPEWWLNLQYLFETNLPVLFGSAGQERDQYFLGPALASSPGVWLVLWISMTAAVSRVTAIVFSTRVVLPPVLLFLFLVGAQAAVAYVASCGVRSPVLVRYTFLVLLVPVAIAAAYLRVEPRRSLRAVAVALLIAWAGWSAQQYGQIIASYMINAPESGRAVVARELERRNLRYGYAPYWVAYHITFLANERVILASGAPSRILSYDSIVARAPRRVYVQPEECPGEAISGLWVCLEEPEPSAPLQRPDAIDVNLPTPEDLAAVWAALEGKYRSSVRTPASSAVDREGAIVWTLEYLRYRLNACDHAAAVTGVFRQIDGAGGAAPCGPVRDVMLPSRDDIGDFTRQLETKYRQGLQRAPIPVTVDLDNGAWWIAQYVRYRALGCAHNRALGRTVRQVDGLVALEGGC